MNDELTVVDIKKMQEEIDYRKYTLAPKFREMIKSAKEQGDLSENDEYHTARREWRANEGRIAYLEKMIESARIISTDSAEDEAGLFDEIDIYYTEKDKTETIRVVTTLRNDALKKLISKESPLGKAVLGHKKGETVTVVVNETRSYKVIIKDIRKGADDDSLEINKY